MPRNKRKPGPIAERFFSKIDKNGPMHPHDPRLGPCWLWLAGHLRDGYGRFFVHGRGDIQATHVSLELAGKPLEPGQFALHSCDNPPCVNDAHLLAGDNSLNMRDAWQRGRSNVQKDGHRFIRRGAENNHAKVTAYQVLDMRQRFADGSVTRKELVAQYDLCLSTVCRILNREHWAHV